MALETVTHISDLVVTNPTSTDPKSEGDNHLRNIKKALKTDFPNISGAVTKTHTQLNNALDKTGDTMTGDLNVPSLNTGQLAGLRNKIINGGFDVWQRGTSFVAPTSLYTADRWFAWTAQTAVTISRVSRPTGNAGTYALQVNASSGTNAFNLTQPMESFQVDSIKGKVITISVSGIAASGTQAFSLGLLKNATADIMLGGSWSAVSAASTITLTTTAQRFSATFTVPDDGTANGLMAQIAQSNIASGVNFRFWDFQLEVGSVATTFEHRPYGMELALCQRYYYRVAPGIVNAVFCLGHCISTTRLQGVLQFPVNMRVAPSAIEQSGTAGNYAIRSGSTTTTLSGVPAYVSATTTTTALINADVASGFTAGYVGTLQSEATTGASAYLGWSAEL